MKIVNLITYVLQTCFFFLNQNRDQFIEYLLTNCIYLVSNHVKSKTTYSALNILTLFFYCIWILIISVNLGQTLLTVSFKNVSHLRI